MQSRLTQAETWHLIKSMEITFARIPSPVGMELPGNDVISYACCALLCAVFVFTLAGVRKTAPHYVRSVCHACLDGVVYGEGL